MSSGCTRQTARGTPDWCRRGTSTHYCQGYIEGHKNRHPRCMWPYPEMLGSLMRHWSCRAYHASALRWRHYWRHLAYRRGERLQHAEQGSCAQQCKARLPTSRHSSNKPLVLPISRQTLRCRGRWDCIAIVRRDNRVIPCPWHSMPWQQCPSFNARWRNTQQCSRSGTRMILVELAVF